MSVIGITVGTPLNPEKIKKEAIAPIEEKVSRIDKRITNLEQGIVPDPFETDSSVAYMKVVPENALPYAEIGKVGGMTYKDGDTLKSAKVTAIEKAGANLIPFPYELVAESGGTKFVINPDLSIDVSGKPYRSIYETMATLTLPAGTYYLHNYGVMSPHVRLYATDDSTYFANSSFTLTKESSVRIRIAVYDTFDGNTVRIIPLFKRGTAVPPSYMPYRKDIFPIPTEIQALDGYGVGINESCYNYIDYEKRQFVKRVGVIDMGTLEWEYNAPVAQASATLRDAAAYGTVLCARYNTTDLDSGDNGIHIQNSVVNIIDYSFGDAEAFIPAVSGEMLYYELATPEVTDISDILSADNLIRVDGSGTMTVVNEHSLAAPSEITYMLKE